MDLAEMRTEIATLAGLTALACGADPSSPAGSGETGTTTVADTDTAQDASGADTSGGGDESIGGEVDPEPLPPNARGIRLRVVANQGVAVPIVDAGDSVDGAGRNAAERWPKGVARPRGVVLGERHLVRLVRDYADYYHDDRCYLGLDKDTPAGRPATPRLSVSARLDALPRVGGLHHRYEWRDAA